MKQLTRQNGYTEKMVEEANCIVRTFGSYRLRVRNPGKYFSGSFWFINLTCCVYITARHFGYRYMVLTLILIPFALGHHMFTDIIICLNQVIVVPLIDGMLGSVIPTRT